MKKLIAVAAAGALLTGSAFAGGKGCCGMKQAANGAKPACSVSMASLNLTAEQKQKMQTAMTEHEKAGCSARSEAKLEAEAKSILSKEQFAKFKAEEKGEKAKTQS